MYPISIHALNVTNVLLTESGTKVFCAHMMPCQTAVLRVFLITLLYLPFSLLHGQVSNNQGVAAQPVRGSAPLPRGGRGMDPRVQNRTYLFTNTGEMLPYAVFVSSKVTKEKPAPLIIALRGAGGNPTAFLRGTALDLAEEGGYILVGAMGYNSMGSFGMPATGRGGPGGRAGSANAPQTQGTNQTMRGSQPAQRGGAPGSGGTAETDPAKISEYSEKDVMNVLAMVRKEFNIDDRRIYLVGHSQGGAGALHLAEKYSSIWAAAAMLSPGAPGFQLDPNAKFKDVPLLIMVGAADTLIATPRRIDEQLKSENIAHDYKELPGLDHGGIVMGGMPDVFKFFSQHTKPEAK
jgi:dienelactone hydrolase